MEKRFRRDFDELDAIFEFVSRCLAKWGNDTREVLEVQLIVEELFTNLVKYNRGHHEIRVRLQKVAGAVEIVLVDEDVEPFDVTVQPAPEGTRSLEERGRGGLGLHLVRQMADDVRYEYAGRRSTITVTKKRAK
jgi:serine/threonine-protein kinase RsbW